LVGTWKNGKGISIGFFWNDWSRNVGSLAAKLPSYGKGNVYDTHCHHEDRCHAMQRKQKKEREAIGPDSEAAAVKRSSSVCIAKTTTPLTTEEKPE
jgi:hypothetical protein